MYFKHYYVITCNSGGLRRFLLPSEELSLELVVGEDVERPCLSSTADTRASMLSSLLLMSANAASTLLSIT